MSQLDAVVSPTDLIAQAAKWGHDAIAITDHSVVQSFPEAFAASEKYDMKVIYGMEANLVDDGVPIAYNTKDIYLEESTFVVFDVVTTGLLAVYDMLIVIVEVNIIFSNVINK